MVLPPDVDGRLTSCTSGSTGAVPAAPSAWDNSVNHARVLISPSRDRDGQALGLAHDPYDLLEVDPFSKPQLIDHFQGPP